MTLVGNLCEEIGIKCRFCMVLSECDTLSFMEFTTGDQIDGIEFGFEG